MADWEKRRLEAGSDNSTILSKATLNHLTHANARPYGRKLTALRCIRCNMSHANELDLKDWLNLVDIQAIPDFDDKVQECEFFFALLAQETDRSKFRWLFAGFLNAVYSFFESSALTAHFRFTDPDGDIHVDAEGLSVLQRQVKVHQDKNRPNFVKTSGLTPLTKQLYEIRKSCTHHFSLSIMAAGQSLPEDFLLGNLKGQGTPVMPLCREALKLVQSVYAEINE